MKIIQKELSQQGISNNHDQVKNRIMSAAEELHKKMGSQPVSMSDLAKKIGISKKTVYQYFVNKDELVDCIVSKKITLKKKELEERKRLSDNPIQEAFIAWHIIEDFMYDFNCITLLEIQKSYHQTFNKITEFKNVFLFQFFYSNVERGITAGLYRDTIKPTIICRYMLEVLFMPRNNTKPGYFHYSPAEIDNQLLTYHLHGLATEKGIRLIRRYKNEALAHTSKLMGNANINEATFYKLV